MHRSIVVSVLLMALLLAPYGRATANAQSYWCNNIGVNNYHDGMTSSSNYNRTAVQGLVDTGSQFDICGFTPWDFDNNGPSAWISFEPRLGCAAGTSCILQIGIIECADFGNPACAGQDHPRFMWAVGGCNGEEPLPKDLGPADYGNHAYVLWRYLDAGFPKYRMQIDGGATIPPIILSETDSRMSCWISGERRVGWFFEKWDRGDSIGDASLKSVFTYAHFKSTQTSGWQLPGWTNGTHCAWEDMSDQCVFGGTDILRGWTP
jgi:hypothetical protein